MGIVTIIIILAIIILIIISNVQKTINNEKRISDSLRKHLNELESASKDLLQRYNKMSNEHENILLKEKQTIERETSIKKQRENLLSNIINNVNKYLSDKKEHYKYLAGMVSDYLVIAEDNCLKELEKSHSMKNLKRQVKINELKNDKKKLIEENKILKYEIEYIKTLIPDVEDIVEYDEIGEDYKDEEWIYKYLPKEEYNLLSETEKNERALEYYLKRKKSNWEIGRDFERYIGYLYEKEGYNVNYFGIEMKLKDMGRDLIIENDNEVIIAQCKYWSKHKTIHEKHICQLFGTLMKYKIDNKNDKRQVMGIFVTHTDLSIEAKEFAKALNIGVKEKVPMGEYPIIKCNKGKDEFGKETRIYHLPMDQQYDKVIIEKVKGEMYAFTIKEAENAGFRRAHRFQGLGTNNQIPSHSP